MALERSMLGLIAQEMGTSLEGSRRPSLDIPEGSIEQVKEVRKRSVLILTSSFAGAIAKTQYEY